MSDGSRRTSTLAAIAIIAATLGYLYATVAALNQREHDADTATNGRLDRLEQSRFTRAQRRWALLTGIVSSLVVVVFTTHPHIGF